MKIDKIKHFIIGMLITTICVILLNGQTGAVIGLFVTAIIGGMWELLQKKWIKGHCSVKDFYATLSGGVVILIIVIILTMAGIL